jgi:O-antigen/teichoic acid export membrane protein
VSLKKNILANYASQLYVTAAGIVMVPLYIKYMGAEAYGLVGFFAMLQAWFNLLDMGLTPTMARESARFNGGAISVLDYRRLARALEGVFAGVALLGGALLFALAQPIAAQWLNASQLPLDEVTRALQLMAIIIALRWMCGLYRGVITGAERLVWLSGFSSLIATGRFVLILPVLMFVSASPLAFFGFQLGMAVLEVAGLAWMAYRLLPPLPAGQRIRWQWAPLKPVLKFSLSIAFTSSIWVLVTQTDKLLLSKILPLADYGYFTVAVLVASGIMTLCSPISSALMPRMARLQAENHHDQLVAVYRSATRLIIMAVIPPALLIIFFPREVLWAWTGDGVLVSKVAATLSLYALGYLFMVACVPPYCLQYAKGYLRFHLIGHLILMFCLIPAMILSSINYGMYGAGWVWLISNAAYFFLWIPLVHNKLMPKLHFTWLARDVLLVLSLPLLLVIICSLFGIQVEDRIHIVFALGLACLMFYFLLYFLNIKWIKK